MQATDYKPANERYDTMIYRRCGKSGLKLPLLSLGLWINFGGVDSFEKSRTIIRRAFDLGITHFDLANNYGPPPGSAEEVFGNILRKDFAGYRDEMIISTKAGWGMWPGPYGDMGSKKYLTASLDQSLKRMGLDYVDIFYHHRPDPDTPLEEIVHTLDLMVKQGKALYVGISSYSGAETKAISDVFKPLGTPFIIHQPMYNMFHRTPEQDLFPVLEQEGKGCIVFSPLSKGLLTNKYLGDIPEDSRMKKSHGFLEEGELTEKRLEMLHALNQIAKNRNQSLAQLALAWTVRNPVVTSALIGVSRVSQLEDNVATLNNLEFTLDEIKEIEAVLGS